MTHRYALIWRTVALAGTQLINLILMCVFFFIVRCNSHVRDSCVCAICVIFCSPMLVCYVLPNTRNKARIIHWIIHNIYHFPEVKLVNILSKGCLERWLMGSTKIFSKESLKKKVRNTPMNGNSFGEKCLCEENCFNLSIGYCYLAVTDGYFC